MFERRIKLLEKLICCAEKAYIAEHMFISFGTLLGAIRPTLRRPVLEAPHYARGIMEHDTDMDVGFLADRFQSGQRDTYYHYCHEAGLFSSWAHPSHRIRRRQDNNDILWFSAKENKQKCCQWFMFDFKGYMFHSKGSNWAHERKFPMAKYPRKEGVQALGLGVPAKFFKELVKIDFEGLKVNVPKMSGSLLDCWYPGWHMPKKGGASAKKTVLVIDRWGNEKSWKIL